MMGCTETEDEWTCVSYWLAAGKPSGDLAGEASQHRIR